MDKKKIYLIFEVSSGRSYDKVGYKGDVLGAFDLNLLPFYKKTFEIENLQLIEEYLK